MSNYTYLFKYILIGDASVGKSCILLQFLEGQIREEHDTTIGVEFGAKQIKVQENNIKLQIWDTAGQENFRSIIRSYYRAAVGALLVYDVCRQETFYHLQKWIEEIKNNGNPTMTVMLCGNKIDKESEREVTREQGQQFASNNNLLFFETSAKTGANVNQAFIDLSQSITEKIKNGTIDPNTDPGIKVGKQNPKANDQSNTITLQPTQPQTPKQEDKQKKCC